MLKELSPRKRIINLLKENKKLAEFDYFAQRISDYKTEIKPTENPKFPAATFTSSANLSTTRIIINTTYSDADITKALNHEITHLDQQATLLEKGHIFTNYNIKSQIAYEMLSEVHANSNQDEFELRKNKLHNYNNNFYQEYRIDNVLAFFEKEKQETLDIYLDQAIGNAKNRESPKGEMPFDLATSTFRVGEEQFLEASTIKEILFVENLSDLTDLLIERSPLKDEFKTRIEKLEQR